MSAEICCDTCRNHVIDSAIAAVEDVKEQCAARSEPLGNDAVNRVHYAHQAAYLKSLEALEALRVGDKAPAGGVRAERVQLWLLSKARDYVQNVDSSKMPGWFSDAPQGCYVSFLDWLIEQVNAGINLRQQFPAK